MLTCSPFLHGGSIFTDISIGSQRLVETVGVFVLAALGRTVRYVAHFGCTTRTAHWQNHTNPLHCAAVAFAFLFLTQTPSYYSVE